MLKRQCIANLILFLILSGVPLFIEFVTAKPGYVPGTGFDILLYEPFDFAYALLAGIIFISLNVVFSARRHQPKMAGLALGVVLTVLWFVLSFLAVGQLHLSLGGKL